MAFLVAAVVVVGLLGVVNLVFCLGVIRRLREHTEVLDRLGSAESPVLTPDGGTVAAFSAATVDGTPVSRDSLGAGTLVGFVSTTCPACIERLPEFVGVAERHDGPVLGVVVGLDDDSDLAAAMVEALGSVGQVIHETSGGPVAAAFGVRAFPAFALLDAGGAVRASGLAPAALAADVTA
jgi:thiol-disulfide isomerase/thioredoxin